MGKYFPLLQIFFHISGPKRSAMKCIREFTQDHKTTSVLVVHLTLSGTLTLGYQTTLMEITWSANRPRRTIIFGHDAIKLPIKLF